VTEPRAAVEPAGPRVRAVLFDLDDTLFDHRHCTTASLRAVHERYECFQRMAFDELERTHAALLEELHNDVMVGRVSVDAARQERFRRLFLAAGTTAGEAMAAAAAAGYRLAYLEARRAIAGADELLARVRQRARIVVVSNNVVEEQRGKLRHCALDRFVDALVVSEEEGISKPDPEIFRRALARVDCPPAEAVMLGDSWAADIAGARAAGIRAIWVNPRGAPRPEPADDVVEVRGLEPVEPVLGAIFGCAGVPEAHADRR
jgi:HAD superfamily hydrolase (TIGR01549 family)